MIGTDHTLPVYREPRRQNATDYDEVVLALAGEPARQLQDMRGRLVLSVAVPIQDLRLVRGALLVSISGGKIETEIADVNVVFIKLFGIVTLITIALSVCWRDQLPHRLPILRQKPTICAAAEICRHGCSVCRDVVTRSASCRNR